MYNYICEFLVYLPFYCCYLSFCFFYFAFRVCMIFILVYSNIFMLIFWGCMVFLWLEVWLKVSLVFKNSQPIVLSIA